MEHTTGGFLITNFAFVGWAEPIVDLVVLAVLVFAWWYFFNFKWPDGSV